MLKKLSALAFATLVVTNVPVMAVSGEDALAQVVKDVEAVIQEGAQAGLSPEQTMAIATQAVDQVAATSPLFAHLTQVQTKRFKKLILGVAVIVVVGYVGYWAVNKYKSKSSKGDTPETPIRKSSRLVEKAAAEKAAAVTAPAKKMTPTQEKPAKNQRQRRAK